MKPARVREIKIPKHHVLSRRQQAQKVCCPYHPKGEEVKAEEFCGAWVNDGSGNLGSGAECHTPLCYDCAEIRLQIWLCRVHGKGEAK
jgi:hypothetical protein